VDHQVKELLDLGLELFRGFGHADRVSFSKLEVIFCAVLAENNFVNALILSIRARIREYDLT
jgi:hypothetical protein